jgi:hypothetical protein
LRPLIIIFILPLLFTSCKRDTTGDLKVINDTNQMIWVKFSHTGNDTVIGQVEAHSNFVIQLFDVKGNPRKFACCPCQTNVYYVYNTAGKIKRDPQNSDNWDIPGQKKLSLTGNGQIQCEFRVIPEDL